MSFRRLKWLAILAPIFFIGLLEYARYALAPVRDGWQGHLLMDAAVLLGAVFFYGAVFSIVDSFQKTLEQRNNELAAMHSAGLDIVSDLSLDTVLLKVVERAKGLLGTRYGALAVYDGDERLFQFVTSGIDREQIARIGPPPKGHGLLGFVLREGQQLRLRDFGQDPRSCGLPPEHPPMHSLLAVPVICRGPFRGNLYLSEKLDGGDFSEGDAEILERFATQAAIAVDNAFHVTQAESLAVAEERLRLAREMHDGQAQVLAFVNTKAQAVRELMRTGATEKAATQLDHLASAAREVYADVREGILGLRAAIDAETGVAEALQLHVERWQDQSGIRVAADMDAIPRLRADVELQLLRVVQEALANVRKHSEATSVEVTLKVVDDGVILARVVDDGRGFDPSSLARAGMPRFGLATMRERAEAIGATLEIASRPEEGCRVELTLPLPDRAPLETTFNAPYHARTTPEAP